jgi:TonB-dependent receptor
MLICLRLKEKIKHCKCLSRMKKLFFSILLLLFSIYSIAQKGILKGTINDSKTGESLVGTTILMQGTTTGTITDFDGNYVLPNISPGSYNMVISFISYQSQIIRVEIKDGEETVLNVKLEPATLDVGEVQVVAKKRTDTEMSLLSSLKSTDLIVSGISSQQISKTQDKDAAEVIRRVPGITITDGRFVVVRGLIERYNSIMISGASAPSFESDKRSFSFDAIPSGMINNILIYKSPAPELPADFAGAAINIETKNVADENSFVFSYGAKYVSNTTFNNNFQTYPGGKTDWLGFDDGTRDIPAGVPSNNAEFKELYNWQNVSDYTTKTEELVRISKLFSNNWETQNKSSLPDQNLSLSLQRRFVIRKVSFGNITSLNYSTNNEYLNIKRTEYQDYSEAQNIVLQDFDFVDERSKETAKIGFIHNWNVLYGKNQRFEFRNFLNQIGNNTTNFRNGVNYYNGDTLRFYDLKFDSRFVYSGQLAGTQNFNNGNTKVSWMAGYGLTKNNQPDNRRLKYLKQGNQFKLLIGKDADPYLGGRLWLDMDENTWDYKVDLEHKFHLFNSKNLYTLKSGFYIQDKNRSFGSRLIGTVAVSNPPDIFYNPVGEIYADENIFFDKTAPFNQHGISYRENTNASDSYNAYDNLQAGYLSLKIPVTTKLNLYGGVRVERFKRKITDFYEITNENTDDLDIIRDTTNFFPSAGLIYNINEKNLIRLTYGKTINRPEFREMSNFAYQDFDMFVTIHGNEDLQNAYIDNYDFRYEWYPSAGEIISVAAFYKDFTNPIEVFLIPAGTGYDYKPYNTKEGYSMGLEFDMRKKLIGLENAKSFLHYLKDLTIVFNTSIIQSKINTSGQEFARETERIMQGQSPYIVNLGLNYQPEEKGLSVGLNYNVIGKRIVYVGTPDNPHTWELPRNSLDLTFEKSLSEKVSFKAGIKDIINQPLKYVQYYGKAEDIEVDSYSYIPTRNFSVSVIVKL